MRDRRIGKIVFLGSSLILLLAGLAGVERLPKISGDPFRWESEGTAVRVRTVQAESPAWKTGLRPGDRMIEMDGFRITRPEDVQFVVNAHESGTRVSVIVERGQNRLSLILPLPRKYNALFITLNLLLGLMFWGVGVFVFCKKREEYPARVFAWGAVVLGFSIMIVREGFPFHGAAWEYALTVLYCLLYPLVPAFILAFAVLYPRPKPPFAGHRFLLTIFFIPSVCFATGFGWMVAGIMGSNPLPPYRLYTATYQVFRIFMIVYVILAVASLIHSRLHAASRADRSKVQWILWAIVIGCSPFVFLWNLPLALGRTPLIPEGMNYLFMLLVPVAFGFSIVKYHAWDIEVIIQRSIVYAAVTAVIAAAYMILAGFAGYELRAVSRLSGDILTIAFTLAAAVLFSPLRRGIQAFVDRHFYKIRYNYRQAIREFSAVLTSAVSCEEVASMLLDKIHAAVPSERSLLFIRDARGNAFEAAGSLGVSDDGQGNVPVLCGEELVRLAETAKSPLALKNRAEPEAAGWLAEGSCLETASLDCIIPIRMEDRLAGFLGMGRKLSGDKYYHEDFQLLTPMAEQSVTACERLRLREAMILERAEKSKLEELNRLKSEFVSHISHEFRSPLTSIRWSVDNWLDGIPEIPTEKTRPILEIIDDCGRRLDRMIGNLLDITKIEAGKVDLNMEPVDVRSAVDRTIEVLKPLAQRRRIRLVTSIPPECRVHADSDALRTILENLVENALKYSPEGSVVRVESGPAERGLIRISVIDRGAGIPRDKRELVFERFERVKSDKTERQKGLGLGLHIVKKLVGLHGGRVWVEDGHGGGSIFSFTLSGAEYK
jgi:signal transduction histidine kinase